MESHVRLTAWSLLLPLPVSLPLSLSLSHCVPIINKYIYICIYIFYLFIHERHTHTERERQRNRQREKQAPPREPDVGLDPGSPGSHPRLQAEPNLCATGAALLSPFKAVSLLSYFISFEG